MKVDFSKVGTGDWIVLGLGLLLLIFSFFGWVTSSFAGGGSIGGWRSFWFLAPLLVLAITVVRAVQLLTGNLVKEVKQAWLVYAAAAAFVIYLLALINIFASYSVQIDNLGSAAICDLLTGSDKADCLATLGAENYSVGAGFGIWASILLSLALVYFLALSAQKTEKLPVTIPGPKL